MTLEGKSAEKALPLVQLHLDGCRDCREEFEALLEVLRSMANGRGNRVQNTKTIGRILLVVGVLLLVVSILADVVGLGLSPGFGLRQIVGSIAGLALAGVGFWLMRKP